MSILLLGDAERAQIAEAIAAAKAHPIPLDVLRGIAQPWTEELSLANRKPRPPGVKRPQSQLRLQWPN